MSRTEKEHATCSVVALNTTRIYESKEKFRRFREFYFAARMARLAENGL